MILGTIKTQPGWKSKSAFGAHGSAARLRRHAGHQIIALVGRADLRLALPVATSTAAIRNVGFTSILLKNSA
jgi:hypothetical protein